jgi:Flp pilus assembly protein TadG
MNAMRQLWHDDRGISSIEFAIVAVAFFIFLFGIVDFGRAMWEWNSAAKATHAGVRYAAVHNMVAPGLFTYDGVGAAGGNGLPIPAGAINPNPVVCTNTSCNGYGPIDTAAFNAIVTRMQQVYSRVQADNVVVEYLHVPGLGFAGNPYGPDFVPLVTVKMQGLVFNLATGLLGFASITMPAFAASMPGEDLAN